MEPRFLYLRPFPRGGRCLSTIFHNPHIYNPEKENFIEIIGASHVTEKVANSIIGDGIGDYTSAYLAIRLMRKHVDSVKVLNVALDKILYGANSMLREELLTIAKEKITDVEIS